MHSIVIIPTYNEADNIVALIPAVLKHEGFGALIVDDNSPDGTGRVADALAREYPGRVDVLHRERKTGLARAYVAGFSRALDGPCQFVFQMDADFSHDPDELAALLSVLRDGHADVVIGSRYVTGGGSRDWPLRRRLLSWGGSTYARAVLGMPVRDLTGGFKGFRRGVLESLDLAHIRSHGYAFQIEMNYLCHQRGFTIAEVPIIFKDRQVGSSKLSGAIFWESFFIVWRLRLGNRPPGWVDVRSWTSLRSLVLSWRHWFPNT